LVERHSRILEVEKTEFHWSEYAWVPGNAQGNVSIVLATDLSSVEGVRAAYLVLKHAESKEGAARVSVVHNPLTDEASTGHYISKHCDSVEELKNAYYSKKTATDVVVFRGPCEPGTTCTFANSRKANAPTNDGDLIVLARSEAQYASKLAEAFGDDDRSRVLDAIGAARQYAGKRSLEPRSDVEGLIEAMLKEQGVEQLVLTSDGIAPQATAIFDPLSEAAQRAAPVLLALRDVLGLKVRLVLAPDPELSEMPLQKYYRFALDVDGAPRAKFASLPKHQVLTLRVDTPEAWDAQMASASSDPDNILADARIVYELKSLVVMGQCYDVVDSRPPNGLQIQLEGTASDTLVMQNLGYFQLRAQPGAWKIKLASGTRSSELYETVQVEPVGFSRSWYGPSFDADAEASDGVDIVVSDFEASAHQLRVRKRVGKESVELLGEEESSWFFSKKKKKKMDTIHVFSLATGSLYERMLKIMMLSVRKRTSGPIKFWLFENYLTPSFKQGAQALGEKKGFDVSYVTYKWPEWLRTQTVKQRIIWGYKILFLDVLFPLDVPKIIYVDADQVVRGNLRELWDLDLQGHAYGYTPFCDSRKETLGYQFWRSGYWKDHLRGKPYHISALYVVDLDVFRRRGVGDQLRMVYDQLSRDPGSLSNLDQDLPNYAQPQIPIFSLPQDWLWCESWCSDGSKATAKTIDLCNHPATKENKLSMAQRIVDGPLFPESWVELDGEVKAAEGAAGV
jgi:UDP-glucose:glycoprotein glucosyltransferase